MIINDWMWKWIPICLLFPDRCGFVEPHAFTFCIFAGLLDLYTLKKENEIIIFTSTAKDAERVARMLQHYSFAVLFANEFLRHEQVIEVRRQWNTPHEADSCLILGKMGIFSYHIHVIFCILRQSIVFVRRVMVLEFGSTCKDCINEKVFLHFSLVSPTQYFNDSSFLAKTLDLSMKHYFAWM